MLDDRRRLYEQARLSRKRRAAGRSRRVVEYAAVPIAFGGSSYLTRGADLSNNVDSKQWTGSFWWKRNATGLMRIAQANGIGYDILFQTSGNGHNLEFLGELVGDTLILITETTDAMSDTTRWHHVCWSFDMALGSTDGVKVAVDGVTAAMTSATFTNDVIDFTRTNHSIGATVAGASALNGQLADFLMWPGVFLDVTAESNLRLFVTADGKPVDPARSIAALGVPVVGLTGPLGAWHTNLAGKGGAYTVTGALAQGIGPVQL